MFTAKDVGLSLANEHAHLAIDFEATRHAPQASAGGTVHLTGKLAYDPQARVLRLTQARYDPNTQAALAGAAEWLAEPAIVQWIAGAVAFPLDEELKKGDAAVREQVGGIEAPANVDLRLSVTSVSFREARASGEWLHLFFDVKGDPHAALRLTARP